MRESSEQLTVPLLGNESNHDLPDEASPLNSVDALSPDAKKHRHQHTKAPGFSQRFSIPALLIRTTMIASISLFTLLFLRNTFAQTLSETLPSTCPAYGPIGIGAPKQNIWNALTKQEAESVLSYLVGLKEYNFTLQANITGLYDNYINDVDLWKPVKADALNYLDSDADVPARWAQATVVMGNLTEPYVESWLVGPLPISEHTQHKPMDEYFTRNRLPWSAKPFTPYDLVLFFEYQNKTLKPMDDMFLDLFGGTWSSGHVSWGGLGGVTPMGQPGHYDGSIRRVWSWLQLAGAADTAFFLYPLPFYMQTDFTGQDPSKWHPVKVVYDNKIYSSLDEVKEAWKNGQLTKFPLQNDTDVEWALRTPQGERRKFDDVAGPVQVQFDGPRYSVNETEKYVDYQGWTFYVSYDRSSGLRLFDIRFKGERIIYELGVEEALANYAGQDPANQAAAYLDRFYGIGSSGVPLAKGYDCPDNAIFWNISYAYGGSYVTTPQAVCIFEQDLGFPTSRHTAPTSASVTKLYTLNVRSIATVGNYDYLFNYVFYPEGTIEVQVMASGYIQATYWGEGNEQEYGTRIGPQVMGALHDHVIGYKVDFDIAGTANSFIVDTVEVEEKEFPWTEGKKIKQKHIVSKTLATEGEGRLNRAANGLDHHRIVNRDKLNKWGNARGYRIQPGMPSIHITDMNDVKHGDNAHWADYDVSVLRNKDTERSCTGTLNQNIPSAPQVDFNMFFDGESLEQEDLVVYFTLGMHHVPRAEDLPNTVFVGSRSSMLLSPFNWGDGEASRDVHQAFYAKPTEQRQWAITDYDVRPNKNACTPQGFNPLVLGMIDTVAKSVNVPFGGLGMGGVAAPPA